MNKLRLSTSFLALHSSLGVQTISFPHLWPLNIVTELVRLNYACLSNQFFFPHRYHFQLCLIQSQSKFVYKGPLISKVAFFLKGTKASIRTDIEQTIYRSQNKTFKRSGVKSFFKTKREVNPYWSLTPSSFDVH